MVAAINFYAQGKTDIDFDVHFDADSYNEAERIADKNGWRLIGQEETPDEACAIIELIMVKPRIHWCLHNRYE